MLLLENVKVFYNQQLRGRCDLEVEPTFMLRDVPWLVINNPKTLNEMFKEDDRLYLETFHTTHTCDVEACSNGEPVVNDRQIGTLPEESLRNIELHFDIRPDASTPDADEEEEFWEEAEPAETKSDNDSEETPAKKPRGAEQAETVSDNDFEQFFGPPPYSRVNASSNLLKFPSEYLYEI